MWCIQEKYVYLFLLLSLVFQLYSIYLFLNEMTLLCARFCTARKQAKRLIIHFSYLKINLGRMFNSLKPKGKTAKLRNLKLKT